MKEFINPEIEILEFEVEDIMDESVEAPELEDGMGWH